MFGEEGGSKKTEGLNITNRREEGIGNILQHCEGEDNNSHGCHRENVAHIAENIQGKFHFIAKIGWTCTKQYCKVCEVSALANGNGDIRESGVSRTSYI